MLLLSIILILLMTLTPYALMQYSAAIQVQKTSILLNYQFNGVNCKDFVAKYGIKLSGLVKWTSRSD